MNTEYAFVFIKDICIVKFTKFAAVFSSVL